jgi:dTDP-4-amino-4,6-dideoxygalactose transaminase
MSDVSATIGLANLNHTQELINKTKQHADMYNRSLRFDPEPGRESSYWLYTVYASDVDTFIKDMKDNGVECSRVHDRNDWKTIFGKSKAKLPGVDWYNKHAVNIPVGWWLKKKDVEKIITLVKEWGF